MNTLEDELLRELEPARFERQYGSLDHSEREALKRLHHAFQPSLQQVQRTASPLAAGGQAR